MELYKHLQGLRKLTIYNIPGCQVLKVSRRLKKPNNIDFFSLSCTFHEYLMNLPFLWALHTGLRSKPFFSSHNWIKPDLYGLFS